MVQETDKLYYVSGHQTTKAILESTTQDDVKVFDNINISDKQRKLWQSIKHSAHRGHQTLQQKG